MADHYFPSTTQAARKVQQCRLCAGYIPVGAVYVKQQGFYDGHAFRNRYHKECWDAMVADGDGDYEYTDGELEVPEKYKDVKPLRSYEVKLANGKTVRTTQGEE